MDDKQKQEIGEELINHIRAGIYRMQRQLKDTEINISFMGLPIKNKSDNICVNNKLKNQIDIDIYIYQSELDR